MTGQPGNAGGLGGIVRDRRVQVGAAIAAGVGLVVLLTRGRAAATATPAQPGTLDTSATDTYNAVQGDLASFASQLKSVQDQLSQHPTNPPVPVVPVPVVPAPVVKVPVVYKALPIPGSLRPVPLLPPLRQVTF